MLLFKPYHVWPIWMKEKTETRRLWKRQRAILGSRHQAQTKMYSNEYFAKLDIIEIYQQPLGAMTEQDAKAEGGYTLAQYRHVLEEINGTPWDDKQVVFVVRFEKVPFDHYGTVQQPWLTKEGLQLQNLYLNHLDAVRGACSA
ncbi:ASCH domain-containing protein [Methanoregula sp.]|uniref:ASCH domain-containing protein n=1 Tax=Methanoregula sp. TaxID=2052170 RepID=UPI0025E133B3|nr:ASCH domain-containing protein [Methanoregula sp.]